MLEYIVKKINGVFEKHDVSEGKNEMPDIILHKSLKKNLDFFRNAMGDSDDIIIREFSAGKTSAAVIFTDGLINAALAESSIIKPLMLADVLDEGKVSAEIAEERLLSSCEIKKVFSASQAFGAFLCGDTLLMLDGENAALQIGTKGYVKRGTDTPQTDSVIRGPREAFIENLRTNTALLRRRIKSPSLTVETLSAGRQTKTKIAVVYLKNVANPKLIEEIKKRISKTDTDAILDSGYIQQFITDSPTSLFDTISGTEKPDIAAGKILEGRAAVIVDGSPFVLTAPMYFAESFQSPEDYYISPYAATWLRIVRYISFYISILALPVYVAITSFHHDLIPLSLLYTMAAAEAGTPFPAAAEAFIMTVVFEILKEAGVRLPKPVGQAVSIVGALVIGETAVSAGLIGAPIIIAVAITAVTAFVVPQMTNTIVILRFVLLLLASFTGGFGISIGLLATVIHLTALRSFGTPFFAPFAPMRPSDMKDAVVRAPLWALLTRPENLSRKNPIRQQYRNPFAEKEKSK